MVLVYSIRYPFRAFWGAFLVQPKKGQKKRIRHNSALFLNTFPLFSTISWMFSEVFGGNCCFLCIAWQPNFGLGVISGSPFFSGDLAPGDPIPNSSFVSFRFVVFRFDVFAIYWWALRTAINCPYVPWVPIPTLGHDTLATEHQSMWTMGWLDRRSLQMCHYKFALSLGPSYQWG